MSVVILEEIGMRKAGCQDAVMRGVVVLILAAKAQVILRKQRRQNFNTVTVLYDLYD